MDSYQLLKRSCEQWSTYPSNLLRPDQRRNVLQNYRLALEASERQLFQASTEDIHILEPSDSPNGYIEQTIASPFDLRKHLEQNRKDPHSSLIFIHSDGIPASFLDYLSCFGYSNEPQDYHMTGFDSYYTIGDNRSKGLEIQQLGRSGSEHAVQYMLRSIEKPTDGTKNTTWDIRQMAVYHEFDLINGKSLWLNIKTDNAMSQWMKDAMTEDPILNSALSRDVSASFAATLRTHLVHLEWCEISWRECICDTELEIRRTLKGLKTAQAGNKYDIHASSPAEHAGSGTEAKTIENDGVQRSVSWRLTEEIDDLTDLDRFPFRESQKLDSLLERLEQSQLVIQLNMQTLRDISDHYENLATRDNLPGEMVTRSFFSDLDSFSHRVGRIQKNLEIRVTQVKSLMSWLRKERELFEEILRYRSVQASCFLTKTSHLHLDRMQKIANKAQEDTRSMHSITLVTLLFLPATFVVGFFSIRPFNSDGSESIIVIPEVCRIAPDLFVATILPLTCITLLFRYFLRARYRESTGVGPHKHKLQ